MNILSDIDPLTVEKVGDHLTIYHELQQGSDEWLAARCGLITASEVKLLLTPTLKAANNDKQRQHIYELIAQRLTNYVEPAYVSDDMLRGQVDEIDALIVYSENLAPVNRVGFITNDKWGFTLGYSPDGLIGEHGAVEVKSRRQKYQAQTILDHVATGSATAPQEYMLQLQTGLMVSERQWIDFVSYCGGMPMCVMRIYPDDKVQAAIAEAAASAEEAIREGMAEYRGALGLPSSRTFPTERKIYEDLVA